MDWIDVKHTNKHTESWWGHPKCRMSRHARFMVTPLGFRTNSIQKRGSNYSPCLSKYYKYPIQLLYYEKTWNINVNSWRVQEHISMDKMVLEVVSLTEMNNAANGSAGQDQPVPMILLYTPRKMNPWSWKGKIRINGKKSLDPTWRQHYRNARIVPWLFKRLPFPLLSDYMLCSFSPVYWNQISISFHLGITVNHFFKTNCFQIESTWRRTINMTGPVLNNYQTTKFCTGSNWNKSQTTFQSAFKMKYKCHLG